MAADLIKRNAKIRDIYGLEGMVPCQRCNKAIWPAKDFDPDNPTLPVCGECGAAAEGPRKGKG